MLERRQIVQQWKQGEAAVLVTLARAEGSSYRRPGARLLISPTGQHAGTISGGCLEADVLRKAAWRIRDGAVIEHYSMRFDDTAEIPFGLGCGGTVDLLLEPAATPECHALFAAMEQSLRGDEYRVATWLPAPGRPLQRAIFNSTNQKIFSSPGLTQAQLQQAIELAPEAISEDLILEQLGAPQRLIVYGAGEDARPLVSMAALLGWSVLVADGRAQFATRERFPHAEQVVALSPAQQLDIRPNDAVVIMTHSYEQDRSLLAASLLKPTRYLGLLGARHRTSVLISEAAAIIALPIAVCCARLYAPVGLDLGGDGPEAIALAIISQIQAVAEGRAATQRRLTPADVAQYLAQGGVPQMLRAECTP